MLSKTWLAKVHISPGLATYGLANNAIYVDLVKNPERFTGYAGDSARRVWQAIYEQNCFQFVFGTKKQLGHAHGKDEINDLCLERRAFYRVVSGMHASISIHLCKQWLNITSGEWV